MKDIVYIFLCLFIFANKILYAQNTDNSKDFVNSVIQVYCGYLNPSKNNEFFEIYKNDIGGKKESFHYTLNFGIANKISIYDKFKLVISLNRYGLTLSDDFNQKIETNNLLTRRVIENFSWTDYPCLVNIEYSPNTLKQFKSYAGLGIGLVFSKLYWEEKIESYNWDIRKSGIIYDDIKEYPTIRIYCGTELDFDKSSKKSFFGGLTIEPRINYIYRKIDFFAPISPQIRYSVNGNTKYFWFNNFIFELNLGLTFNFYFKK